MRVAVITFIVIVMIALVGWILTGTGIDHPAQLLPLVSGFELNSVYEVGGIAMVLIFLWGVIRMVRQSREDE